MSHIKQHRILGTIVFHAMLDWSRGAGLTFSMPGSYYCTVRSLEGSVEGGGAMEMFIIRCMGCTIELSVYGLPFFMMYRVQSAAILIDRGSSTLRPTFS